MELGLQSHHADGLLGPNSIIAVCMDPLGYAIKGAQDPIPNIKAPTLCGLRAAGSGSGSVQNPKKVT